MTCVTAASRSLCDDPAPMNAKAAAPLSALPACGTTHAEADARSKDALLVVCLCAQWCGVCREYRATFDTVAAAHPGVRFEWMDVEDEADVIDNVDIDNFPTLLIGSGTEPRFFGTVMPPRATLHRLVQAQAQAERGAADLPDEVGALWARVRSHLGPH